jgi:hypothetical protein
VFFWWIATGLDNFVPGGKGPHTVEGVTSAITDTPARPAPAEEKVAVSA